MPTTRSAVLGTSALGTSALGTSELGASELGPRDGRLGVLSGPDGADPRVDAGVALALLQDAAGSAAGVLRVHRPAPTVAFSRQDTLSPGFGRAVAASRAHGFVPVLRSPGGRAVAYHEGTLCLDLVVGDGDPRAGITGRFVELAEVLVAALTGLGVPAAVGPVPDEYCPGRFSVHARGVKLVGTAQRVVRAGWYLGAVLQVEGADRVREVIPPVYAALGLPCDPATVGAVRDLAPDADVPAVTDAVLAALAERVELVSAPVAGDLLDRASAAALQHPLLP